MLSRSRARAQDKPGLQDQLLAVLANGLQTVNAAVRGTKLTLAASHKCFHGSAEARERSQLQLNRSGKLLKIHSTLGSEAKSASSIAVRSDPAALPQKELLLAVGPANTSKERARDMMQRTQQS